MSRGPGRWQRWILDAVDEPGIDIVYVVGHLWQTLERPATRAEEVAVRRAVKRLAIDGRIWAFYLPANNTAGIAVPQLCAMRPDAPWPPGVVPYEHQPDWISVGPHGDTEAWNRGYPKVQQLHAARAAELSSTPSGLDDLNNQLNGRDS